MSQPTEASSHAPRTTFVLGEATLELQPINDGILLHFEHVKPAQPQEVGEILYQKLLKDPVFFRSYCRNSVANPLSMHATSTYPDVTIRFNEYVVLPPSEVKPEERLLAAVSQQAERLEEAVKNHGGLDAYLAFQEKAEAEQKRKETLALTR